VKLSKITATTYKSETACICIFLYPSTAVEKIYI